jgi:hypothetical protein
MGWVEMSERELRRAEVLASVAAGRLTMTAAAGLMGITRRQAHRLALQFTEHGAAGLRHHARGRPSNRLLGSHVRQLALAYVTEHYGDFGPTLAAEKLREQHNCLALQLCILEMSESMGNHDSGSDDWWRVC